MFKTLLKRKTQTFNSIESSVKNRNLYSTQTQFTESQDS
jgi:hypothetical protein